MYIDIFGFVIVIAALWVGAKGDQLMSFLDNNIFFESQMKWYDHIKYWLIVGLFYALVGTLVLGPLYYLGNKL